MKSNPHVDALFAAYPDAVRPKMERLRELVHEVANESPEMGAVEESLKWGEPGFRTKMGSALRTGFSSGFSCVWAALPNKRHKWGKRPKDALRWRTAPYSRIIK